MTSSMTFGQKILKPLRFLSLTLALGPAVAYFASPAHSAIVSGKDKCIEEFAERIKSIKVKAAPAPVKVDLEKIDPPAYCRSSEGAENNNALDPAQRPKLKLGKNEEFSTSYAGACHASYEAVSLVYEKLVASRKETCNRIYNQIDEKFPNCLSKNPPDTCKENVEEMVSVYQRGKKKLQDNIIASVNFLDKYATWNLEAKNKFTEDLQQLRAFRTLGADGAQKLAAPVTPPEAAHQIQAANQGSPTLQAYLDKLELRKSALRSLASRVSGGDTPASSPIDEQEAAKKLVESFKSELERIRNQEERDFNNQLAIFTEKLKKPGNTNSLGDGLKYVPAAAPLASGLLTNNSAAPASTIAGSSGALPALAIAGAAGAAGMAMGQKSAASSGLGSPTGGVEGPVMTPNNKAPATQFGGGENNAPVPAAPATALDVFVVDTTGGEQGLLLTSELRAAGLRAISFGVESLSPETLKRAGRRPTPDAHQRRIVDHCRRIGVVTAAFYVLGFLQDTRESIEATIDYAVSLRSTVAQFKLLTPYPGTPMWKQLGPLVTETNWERFDGFTPLFTHPNLSATELQYLLGAAYTRFYMRPSYLSNYLRVNHDGVGRVVGWLDHHVRARQVRHEDTTMARVTS